MAASPLSEQEIQFRKRARRRLVGAVALVLLMVTVLPMLLGDREAPAPQQEIAITIPSQDDTEFSSRIVPVAPQSEQPSASQDVQLASPLEKSVAQDQVEKAVKPAPEEKSQAAPVKPESAPAVQEARVQGASAEAAAPQAETKPVGAKTGAFTVQVGVFTDGPNLKALESKVAAQGLRANRENLNTPKGIKIRLRTGAYATRGEAEVAQAKLKAAGIDALVVALK